MKTLRVLAFVIVVAVSVASVSFASDVDGLLDLLVKKSIITQEEAADLRQELAAQKKADARKGTPVSSKVPVRLSGYAQVRGTVAQGENDSFWIRRARVGLAGELQPDWTYKLQVDFGNTSRKAVESVDFGRERTTTNPVQRPVLLDAQITHPFTQGLVLSVGQFKIPFSYENLVSSTELDTINRAQVVEKLVPGRDIGSQGRDIGATVSGTRPQWDYALGVFNGNGINTTDDNDQKDFAARAVFRATPALALGLSGYRGTAGPDRVTRNRVGGEVVYRNHPWTFRAEYVAGTDASIDKNGWYIHGGYRFNPKWEGVARFDRFDPDRSRADDRTDILTLGANHFISDVVKLQINYEHRTEESPSVKNDALLTQLQVKF